MEGTMDKKKIVVVDDNENILAVLANRLTNAGYEVIKTSNAQVAIDLARSEQPALVISDVAMPDIDGGKLAKILAEDPTTKHIPVLFLTCLLRKEEEKDCDNVCGRRFLAKPYDPEELLKTIALMIASNPSM
jgi:CheY-like chemotaxis protein